MMNEKHVSVRKLVARLKLAIQISRDLDILENWYLKEEEKK